MTRPLRHPLLAIDTATAHTGLALFDDGVVSELNWLSERNQTVELLPAIVWLLDQQGLTVDDIVAIAVSLGPGSFNGLRVGLSTAKGLCFALQLPCLGVETLDAAALDHVAVERQIRPLYDAGRGEVATSLYRGHGGTLNRLEEPRLVALDLLAAEIDAPTLVCGELREEWIAILRDAKPDLVTFPARSSMVRHASSVAQLGWRRWKDGERDDVVGLQPIYLRRPAITPSSRTFP